MACPKGKENEERDEQTRQSDEQREQREKEMRDLERSLGKDVDEPSFLDELASDTATGLFRYIVFDMHRQIGESLQARNLRKPLPSETPHFIANGKQEGLNCQITADVHLTLSSGEEQTRPVSIVVHQPVEDDESDLPSQIATLSIQRSDDSASPRQPNERIEIDVQDPPYDGAESPATNHRCYAKRRKRSF